MTKARELAELGKAVSVHDNRLDFDRAVVIPGLIDAAGTTAIADGSVTTAKIADDAVTTAKVDTNITVAGTLGVAGVVTANAGITVDNITIDGTQIDLSSGSLTLDVAGNIVLDANSGEIHLTDGGTQFAQFTNSSLDFIIGNATQDKDIIFKGNDGGSVITALTLDMSDAGTAIFNHDIILGAGNEISITGDGSNSGLLLRGNASSASIVGTHSAQPLVIRTNSAERMRIDAIGRVMIGTTTEGVAGADELTVGTTTAGNGITIRSASNSSGALFFSDGTSGGAEYDGGFEYNHNSQFMRFISGASERMRLDTSGLMINTTTAFNGLNGRGDIVVGNGSSNGGMTIFTGSSNQGAIAFADGTSGDQAYRGMVEYDQNTDSMAFKTAVSERMRIDANGYVTKPNQPMFAVNTIASTSNNNVVNFTGVVTNVGNHWSNANNRFTAPVAGFYQFNFTVFTSRTSATGDFYWDLRVNGTTMLRAYSSKNGSTNGHCQVMASEAIGLSANQYVELFFVTSPGGVGMEASGNHNRFSGFLIA